MEQNDIQSNQACNNKMGILSSKLEHEPASFVLYRIIGNDLFPRHKQGQAFNNLKFILENEEDFDHCEKRWIVNRIVDKQEKQNIIELLNKHEQPCLIIPFIEKEYMKIGFDYDCLSEQEFLYSDDFQNLKEKQKNRLISALYRLKNNYVMNNNGARNVALRDGKLRGKWILPWDGNCFLTPNAWKQIYDGIISSPHYQYFTVPMMRITSNEELLSADFDPNPTEEPQLVFRKDSTEEFNEEFYYGRRPKVELFWRLGIPGKWDKWKDEPWDQVRRPKITENIKIGEVGWVARLSSGMKEYEMDNNKSFQQRGEARLDAIKKTLRHVDKLVSKKNKDSDLLTFLNNTILQKEKDYYLSGHHIPPITELLSDANEALKRGPYSVTEKKSLPPSGNIKDYWHPAPYWWPNPNTKDGLPYIRRDGKRVPGTRLYEPESDNYDRTRLQRVFDDTFILALAWYFTNKQEYAKHGARILEKFFVNKSTSMNPHLNYAQVRMGRNNNEGSSTGIIEMKDMYYFLDSVKLLRTAGVISEEIYLNFKKWLTNYLKWLLESSQGKKEIKATNNHGTFYDLQVASIADFLQDEEVLYETLIRAQSRIVQQFSRDGSQQEELTRATSLHYCLFNYQGWTNLATLGSKWGIDFWNYEAANGACLRKGAEWILSHFGKPWPYKQIDHFDYDRFWPIIFTFPIMSDEWESINLYKLKSKYYPHDGIRPYWNIGFEKGVLF